MILSDEDNYGWLKKGGGKRCSNTTNILIITGVLKYSYNMFVNLVYDFHRSQLNPTQSPPTYQKFLYIYRKYFI